MTLEDVSPQCYAPGSGLIDWWQGETNAVDSVGTNDGTPAGGAGLDSGMVDSAFSLDGDGQAIMIPYATNMATPNFTIELWINPGEQPGGQSFLFGQAFGRQLVIQSWDEGITAALFVTDTDGGFYGVGSSYEIPTDDWTHLAGTWDGVTLNLYVNGELDASGAPGLDATGDSGCPSSIGGVYDGCGYYGQYFNGLIDEVSLYDRALVDCEVAAIYNAGPAGKCKTPQSCAVLPSVSVGQWKGDGNASDLFQSNDGIPQNGVSFVSGIVTQAFSFNDSYHTAVQIPYVPALATNAFSLEAWINPSTQLASPAAQNFIFGQSYGRQLVVRGGVTGLAVAFAVSTDTTHFHEVNGTGEIPIGQWTHLVGTWDGTSLSLYINGAFDVSAAPGVTPWDSGCAFHIGGIYDSEGDCAYAGQYFTGLIDEVTLYQGALSADQVRQAYNAKASGKCYDSDSDGMPDWWEIKYFGNLTSNGTGDSNGNGIPDWLEILMGYNPTQTNGLGTTQSGYGLFMAQPKGGSQLP